MSRKQQHHHQQNQEGVDGDVAGPPFHLNSMDEWLLQQISGLSSNNSSIRAENLQETPTPTTNINYDPNYTNCNNCNSPTATTRHPSRAQPQQQAATTMLGISDTNNNDNNNATNNFPQQMMQLLSTTATMQGTHHTNTSTNIMSPHYNGSTTASPTNPTVSFFNTCGGNNNNNNITPSNNTATTCMNIAIDGGESNDSVSHSTARQHGGGNITQVVDLGMLHQAVEVSQDNILDIFLMFVVDLDKFALSTDGQASQERSDKIGFNEKGVRAALEKVQETVLEKMLSFATVEDVLEFFHHLFPHHTVVSKTPLCASTKHHCVIPSSMTLEDWSSSFSEATVRKASQLAKLSKVYRLREQQQQESNKKKHKRKHATPPSNPVSSAPTATITKPPQPVLPVLQQTTQQTFVMEYMRIQSEITANQQLLLQLLEQQQQLLLSHAQQQQQQQQQQQLTPMAPNVKVTVNTHPPHLHQQPQQPQQQLQQLAQASLQMEAVPHPMRGYAERRKHRLRQHNSDNNNNPTMLQAPAIPSSSPTLHPLPHITNASISGLVQEHTQMTHP